MMKKWLKSLTVIAAVALVIIPCVLFSACNDKTTPEAPKDHTPAVGDEYVCVAKMEWNAAITDEMVAGMGGKEAMEKMMMGSLNGSKIVVTSDTEAKMISANPEEQGEGNDVVVTYTIADGKVTVRMEGGFPDGSETLVLTIKDNTMFGEMVIPEQKDDDGTILMPSMGKIVMTYTLSK